MVLQLTAGALDLSVQGAFVDVIRAIEKGAPLAVIRIMVQTPPYELIAEKSIKSIKELKGKTISIGGQKDVTHVYLSRMLEPNGSRTAMSTWSTPAHLRRALTALNPARSTLRC